MKLYFILTSLLFSVYQMKSQTSTKLIHTSNGPEIYLNPQTILENNVHSLTFKEYIIQGKSRQQVDQYNVIFDSFGKPISIVYFDLKEKVSSDTVLFSLIKYPVDSIIYDEKKNIAQLSQKKKFDEYFKYDSLNNEVYRYSVMHGTNYESGFNITESKYDSQSRLIHKKFRRGFRRDQDTSKSEAIYIYDFLYDSSKLLSVKTVKKESSEANGEPHVQFNEYFFEYKNGFISNVYSVFGKTKNSGRYELLITKSENLN